jgi:hypothetical protein
MFFLLFLWYICARCTSSRISRDPEIQIIFSIIPLIFLALPTMMMIPLLFYLDPVAIIEVSVFTAIFMEMIYLKRRSPQEEMDEEKETRELDKWLSES